MCETENGMARIWQPSADSLTEHGPKGNNIHNQQGKLISPTQNGCHFTEDICRCIFVNEKFCILIKFHLNLFLMIQLTITQHWFKIMAWRRIGDKPSSEPMLNDSLTHICGTRGRWVNFHARHKQWPGGRLNKKDGLTRYGDSHVKDKTS